MWCSIPAGRTGLRPGGRARALRAPGAVQAVVPGSWHAIWPRPGERRGHRRRDSGTTGSSLSRPGARSPCRVLRRGQRTEPAGAGQRKPGGVFPGWRQRDARRPGPGQPAAGPGGFPPQRQHGGLIAGHQFQDVHVSQLGRARRCAQRARRRRAPRNRTMPMNSRYDRLFPATPAIPSTIATITSGRRTAIIRSAAQHGVDRLTGMLDSPSTWPGLLLAV